MSIKFGVTPQVPAQITGVYPIVVTKVGLAWTISLGTGATGQVTLHQWVQAVSQLYNMNTLFTNINANANNSAWQQFYTGYGVTSGDPIATLTQSTFSLTTAQMNALFALAATLPV